MKIYQFLLSSGGLALLHFTQVALFSMMVYILLAEYLRTRQESLIYKLLASFSITLINIVTTGQYVALVFYNVKTPQQVLPLLSNSVFAIIVLSLTRAFIVEYVKDKDKFKKNINLAMIAVAVFYVILQIFWLVEYKEGMVFDKSYFQLVFSVFFILVIGFSIYVLAKNRRSYKTRLIIAFAAIMVVQWINVIAVIYGSVPKYLLVLRAGAPILVPIMFGSVVFKELIDSVVLMVDHLKRILETQRGVILELMKMGSELSDLSDELVSMSVSGWQKLSFVVENIYAQDQDRENMNSITAATKDEIEKMVVQADDAHNFPQDKLLEFEEIELDGEQYAFYSDLQKLEEWINLGGKTDQHEGDSKEHLEEAVATIRNALSEINDISEQTNMLALNATIEAARAGEKGRGFGIVAEGVSELSSNSAKQTKIISDSFTMLLDNIDGVTATAESGRTDVAKALQSVKKLKNNFKDLTILSNLYNRMLQRNFEFTYLYRKSSEKIQMDMAMAETLMDKNSKHGGEMKEAISRHISEIEAIAGLSDTLKELISELNSKTNELIDMAQSIQKITS